MDQPPVLTDLSVKKHHLQNPPLKEICKVLEDGLKKSFTHVMVNEADCPNLTQKPFDLVFQGLCGNPRIVEVGGEANLFPEPKKDRLYNFQGVAKLTEVKPACIIGAAAGPWPYAGGNSEIAANIRIQGKDVNSRSHIIKAVDKGKDPTTEILPNTETRFAYMGSFFVSEGKPGKVLEIECKTRTGSDDYVTCIQKTLATKYQSNPVALGGVFVLREAKAKVHAQPLTSTVVKTKKDLENWLYHFTLSPPIVGMGTIISFDPHIDVRDKHFHGYSAENCGHFYTDTEPAKAEYKGYFSLGDEIIRIDPPAKSKWWV